MVLKGVCGKEKDPLRVSCFERLRAALRPSSGAGSRSARRARPTSSCGEGNSSRTKIGAAASIRKPMPIPDLLRDLLEAAGPSGHEEPASRVWRAAAASFAEVHADTL